MRDTRRVRTWIMVCALALGLSISTPALNGQAPAAQGGVIQSLTEAGQTLEVRSVSSNTGRVTFAASGQEGILLTSPAGAPADERALAFVDLYGRPFGLIDRSMLELRETAPPDALGLEHVRFRQVHQGVPVTAGEFLVHMKGSRVVAANGQVIADLPSNVVPTVSAADAQGHAAALIEKHQPEQAPGAEYSEPRLEIFNRGALDQLAAPSRLAWFVEATGPMLREYIWIDAQSGGVLLNFSQLTDAKVRSIYTAGGGSALPGTLVRSEGGPATGNTDQDLAYTYSGITYDYYLANHGRDSFDNAGGTIISTTNYCPTGAACPYQNAFWNGTQMVYGAGFVAADDVVAHELTHAVTQRTANLFYYMQSGALNESFSDIFGETVDLTDGLGNDSASVRWLAGEDLSVGPFRNMMTPTQFGNPGKMSDTNQFWCATGDSGGVHINSGVPNHAFALMVDGGNYNGRTISGIGLTKAAKIQYRALTVYLTSGAGFLDNFNALNQSCTDLVGTAGISASDCAQVTTALQAVEMPSPSACALATPAPSLCPSGAAPTNYTLLEGFEAGAPTWTVSSTSSTQWGTTGGFAKAGLSSAYGIDGATASDHKLVTPAVTIPAGGRLGFDHAFVFEYSGTSNFDGGVLEYSTDGGTVWTDASSLIDKGKGYGGTVSTSFGNPLGGRSAFVRDSFGYSGTRLNLSALAGQSVRFRFRVATDSSVGSLGWLVDNVGLYTCSGSDACTYTLSSSNTTIGQAGGAGTVTVTPGSGTCAWGATSSVPWITVTSGSGGTGGGAIGYSVAANQGAARVGTITIGGQTFTVNQSGSTATLASGNWTGATDQSRAYTFTVSSDSQSLSPVAFSAATGCSTISTTLFATIAISAGSFSYDTGNTGCTRTQTSGTFTSASTASGTLTYTFFALAGCPCVGSFTTNWTAALGAPAIITHPTDRTASVGQDLLFTAAATGTPAPTFQWQSSVNGGTSWTNLAATGPYSGVTTANLAVSGVTANLSGTQYRVIATNSGGSATSTAATLTIGSAQATVVTGVASVVSSTGATLNGTVNPNGSSTTALFDYGLTTSYGIQATASPVPGSGTSAVAVSAAITALSCNTLYHYRAVATNPGGTTNGSDATFTTGACPPTVVTVAATNVTVTGATLNGTVNPNGSSTTALFDYGLTTGYGSQATASPVPGSGTSAVAVSATIATLTCNTLYHYRASATNPGGTTNGSDAPFTTGACPLPTVSLDKTALQFGATNSGASFVQQTTGQTVRISQSGIGTVSWIATPSQPWLTVTPTSGSGPATLTIGVQFQNTLPVSATSNGTVSLAFTGAGNTTGPITVGLTTITNGTATAPGGAFDTPTDNATGVTGSIAVTGWAIDDVEVSQVRILRDPVAGEAAGVQVFIGTPVFVDGARPDIATANPTLPRNTRAGWGYLLLTNFLPSQGNGTFKLYAYADDADGHTTLLGTKVITCSNSTSIRPFGAIDTPGQGETISGAAYSNFGWVLVRGPERVCPPFGTVTMWFDGVVGPSPGGWVSRSDLTKLFPVETYPGVTCALGVAALDTTTLANGAHTIFWLLTANNGQTDGIGSRYFTVANGSGLFGSVSGSIRLQPDPVGSAGFQAGDDQHAITIDAPALMSAGPRTSSLSLQDEVNAAPLNGAGLTGRRGYEMDTPFQSLSLDPNGRSTLQGEELDRFELQLRANDASVGGHYTGYLRVGEGLGGLPVGSHLDPDSGAFTWQPGVGFVHAYDLVFVRWDQGRAIARQEVRVVLNAKGSNRVGPQVVIDIPSSVASGFSRPPDVVQPFVVAGWAIDADAAMGTGIDALHIWAYPAGGGDPEFVGVAIYGGARPDVAAIFGDRFRDSGYGLVVDALAPGTYDLAVFAWSTATGGFVPAKIVRVTVR